MKKIYKSIYSLNEICIFLFFVIGYLFMNSYKDNGLGELKDATLISHYESGYRSTLNKSIDENFIHRQYKHIEDSLNRIENDFLYKQQCTGSNTIVGLIGLGTLTNENEKYNNQNYLVLNGFYLKSNRILFVDELGSILKKFKQNITEIGNSSYRDYYCKNYDSTKVNYKFGYKDNNIYIPISTLGKWITILIMIVCGYFIAFFTVNFYGGVLAVLSNIANGIPFTIYNYKILNRIANFLILTPIIIIIIKGLVYILLYNSITKDFLWNWKYVLFSNFEFFYFGILVKIVAKAFKKGTILQQENELTI
jgi:Protein of unknown function (DUF2975)